ncbi:MAG: hypothetical protein LBH80_01915, partial [Prevotellaceae bacterium]|nr:hypothetical protein [Prevotellaceae bacterium]
MKTLKISIVLLVSIVLSKHSVMAQSETDKETTDVTLIIKGVKEAKGNILIALGDMENPQKMVSDMIAVSGTDDVT